MLVVALVGVVVVAVVVVMVAVVVVVVVVAMEVVRLVVMVGVMAVEAFARWWHCGGSSFERERERRKNEGCRRGEEE